MDKIPISVYLHTFWTPPLGHNANIRRVRRDTTRHTPSLKLNALWASEHAEYITFFYYDSSRDGPTPSPQVNHWNLFLFAVSLMANNEYIFHAHELNGAFCWPSIAFPPKKPANVTLAIPLICLSGPFHLLHSIFLIHNYCLRSGVANWSITVLMFPLGWTQYRFIKCWREDTL